jgi:hypothetical protein
MKSLLVILSGAVWAISSLAATRYVDINSANPMPPFTNWAIAANVIQDAVDVAEAGDEVVVSNGIHSKVVELSLKR